MTVRKKIYFDVWCSTILTLATAAFTLNIDRFVDVGVPSTVSPATFPRYISVVLVLFLTVYMFTSLRALLLFRKADTGVHVPDIIPADHSLSCILYVGILVAYYFLFQYAGFVLATPPVMAGVALLMGVRSMKYLLPGFVVFTLALYYVTLHILKIQLPLGVLAQIM